MAYLDVAPSVPNGRVVVLLHGKNFGAFFGKSGKPHDYQFTFQALAENTRVVCAGASCHAGVDAAPPEVAKTLGDYSTLGRKAAAAVPGAKLVEIPGVGHLPQVESWNDYAAALTTFLER